MSEFFGTTSTPETTSTLENTTAPQTKQNVPVTRVQVDGNSVIPLLRAFTNKAYSSNVFTLPEAAKLHEVYQFIDNLSAQAQQQQKTKQVKSDVESVTSTLDAVADAVEEAVNKKLSSE